MRKFCIAVAALLTLAFACESASASVVVVRRQRVRVVAVRQAVVVHEVAPVVFLRAPFQTFTFAPLVAVPQYVAPAPVRVTERFEDGQLRERIVEK